MDRIELSTARGLKYCSLMSELGYRLAHIEGRPTIEGEGRDANNARQFEYENVLMHLRKVLELVVYSSFLANGDALASVPNFHGMRKAKKILLQLEKINPHFFPVAANKELGANGELRLSFPTSDEHFHMGEFAPLYDSCSTALHVMNPFSTPTPQDLGRPINEWVRRLRELLKTHLVVMSPTERLLVEMLPSDDHRAHYYHLVSSSHLAGSGPAKPSRPISSA